MSRDEPATLSARHYDGTEKCRECYLCGATRWSCYITPEGRLLPCMPMTASPDQERFPKVQDIGLRKGLRDSWCCGLHGVGAERWSQLPRHLPRCPTAPMAASGSGERPRHGGDADRRVRTSLNSENRGTCCIPIKNCSMRRCGRVNYLPPHDAPEGICASYLN